MAGVWAKGDVMCISVSVVERLVELKRLVEWQWNGHLIITIETHCEQPNSYCGMDYITWSELLHFKQSLS